MASATRTAALSLCLLCLGPVAPAAAGDVTAAPATGTIVIDGRIDEPVWGQAAPFQAFVQLYPQQGAPPGEPTVLRVLYDQRFLYVSFSCRERPEEIVRKLGSRDDPPPSDRVEVSIDFAHDHRSAYLFGVNAGGVQYDELRYGDSQSTRDWDGVWDAAVAALPDGWSAELAIPLRLFRLPPGEGQAGTWTLGFAARRFRTHAHEELSSALIPRESVGYVSRFGHLLGVRDLGARQGLELLPYAAARLVLRPQYGDPARPAPRLLDPSLDLGLDLRAAVGPRLQLNATVNPDFGQVEADRLILNLSNQEAFFPEKRPFFFQGTEVFQPVSANADDPPDQMLFYSRRIGLATPIFGALKLTGELGSRVVVGLLDALVTSPAGVGGAEAAPDRRLALHPERPLHLAPNDEVGRAPPITENYLAAVLQVKLGPASTVGARVASGVPLEGGCTEAQAAADPTPPACAAQGGHAAALDFNLRTPDASWALLGQAEVSRTVGGPPARTLPDGVVLARGAGGWGGFVQGGKLGGEPFRFDLAYSYLSPTLELNPVGFLPTQNLQQAQGFLHWVRPHGWRSLHAYEIRLGGLGRFTSDGRRLRRGTNANLRAAAVLPGFHEVGFELGAEASKMDVREITGSGVPLEKAAAQYLVLFGTTDASRPLVLSGDLAGGRHPHFPDRPARLGWTIDGEVAWRPQGRFDSRLTLTVDRSPLGARWTQERAGAVFLFGELVTEQISVTLRQRLVVVPRLTFQAYAQLFSAFGHYDRFFLAASPDRAPIRIRDLEPTDQTQPGLHDAGLNVNLVVRWEYRLGSTLYAVYSHSSQSLPVVVGEGGAAPATLAPVNLFRGPAVDGFLVKWSYWWDL
jgi:hypothetical protein